MFIKAKLASVPLMQVIDLLLCLAMLLGPKMRRYTKVQYGTGTVLNKGNVPTVAVMGRKGFLKG